MKQAPWCILSHVNYAALQVYVVIETTRGCEKHRVEWSTVHCGLSLCYLER